MNKLSHDSETKAKGQQVITACAFIHQEIDGAQKVFLPKRAKTKKYLPDVFELPGGHIDFNEDIVLGLKREVMEEFGVNINVGDPFASYTYFNEIKESHSIEVIYFATFTDPVDKIAINPEDHSEFGWFTEEELDEVMSKNRIEEDPEIAVTKKGFSLLSGAKLNFG